MEIRQAQLSDLKPLAHLFDLYRQFYKLPSDLAAAEKFLSERIEKNDSVVFIALDNDTMAGFVQLYPCFSSLRMKPLWILNDLFVHPDFRRKQAGQKLMQQAEIFARETKARGLTLRTAQNNVAAQKLYESLGWKRDVQFFSYDLGVQES